MRLHIVMYHYVRDLVLSRYPAIKGLDATLFRQQIEFLKANFTVVRMEDVISAVDGDKLPENAALLTFDDGYIDHYTTVFPILDEMGLQGSFFPVARTLNDNVLLDVNKIQFILAAGNESALYQAVLDEIDYHRGAEFNIPDTKALLDRLATPSRYDSREIVFIKQMLQTVLPKRLRKIITDKLFREFVCVGEAVFAKELYCDTKQLALMKRHGMFIGLHGYDHEWLGNMEQNEYEEDISKALGFMDSVGFVDRKAWVMCYPYGSWDNGVVDYIWKNGCIAGLTTEVAVSVYTDNRLLLPRLDTNDFPPKSDNYKNF